MAEKKIQYSDLIEKKAIPTLINELEKVEKQMEAVGKSAKKIVENSEGFTKNISGGLDELNKIQTQVDKVTKAVETLRTAEKKRTEALTERQKLEKRLAKLRSDEAQEIADIRAQIVAENKALRDNAKAKLQSVNGYKDLTKATNEAQAEFKKLSAELGINSKEAKDAYKEFVKLDDQLREINDAARDGRRDVGRYRLATEKLGKSMKALQAIGIITMLAKVGEFFQANETGGAALEKVFGRLTVSLSVFVNRAAKLIPLVTQSFNNFVISVRVAIKEVQLFAAKMPDALGGSEDDVKNLTAEIKVLEAGIKEGGLTVEDITKAFEGMGDEIDTLIKKNDKLIDNTLAYRKQVVALTKTEAGLLVEREKLQATADDDSISLQEQIEGVKGLIEIEEQLAQIQVDKAQIALKIAKQQQVVALNSVTSQEATAEAIIGVEEAKANAIAIQLENQAKLRNIEIDQLEADLDILLDVSDRRKTIAERLVIDESATYEERAQALKNATKDIDDTFKEEAKLIEERAKVAIDMDKIIGTEDTKELNEYVKSLKLSEREQNRLREIIIERLIATRDFEEAQKDLNNATDEQSILNTDIIAQEEALQALQVQGVDLAIVLEKLQENRTQNEIDDLEFRLSKAKEGSAEFLKIQQELNDKLLAQAQAKSDKQAKIEEEEKAKRIATAESTADFLTNLSNQVAEQRIARIDKAIQDSAAQEQVLLEVVKGGSEEALQALEFERKKQAELALQREKEIQAQARRELGLSAAKIFSSKIAGGTPAGQALAETGTEILALQSLVKSLPTFRDGTEDTGKGGNLDKDGGFLSILHPNEKVFKKEDASIIPTGMSNLEVAMAARESKIKEKQAPSISFDVVVNELKEVKKAIKDKPVMTDRVFDSVRQESIATIQRGNRLERNHRRIGINS